MEWVASTLHTTSEHGVSSITTADAHSWAASRRLKWGPRRFKWTRPLRRKTISGFCACVITFQTQSTYSNCVFWNRRFGWLLKNCLALLNGQAKLTGSKFLNNIRTFQTRFCRRGFRLLTVKEYGIHLVHSSAERWMLRHTGSGSVTDNENTRTHTRTRIHKVHFKLQGVNLKVDR
jgi:hypothetical protein